MINPPHNKVISVRFTLRTGRGVAGTAFFTLRSMSKPRVRAAVRLRFREGTVLARGALSSGPLRLRITGGTGAFRGSRGVVEARGAGVDKARLVLRLS